MRNLQQKLKTMFVCAVLTIMAVSAISIQAKAEGLNYTTLRTDDTWVAGEISVEGEVDFYTITIPRAGWLTVNYQGLGVRDSYIYIMDEDMTKTYDHAEIYYSAENDPKNRNFTLALEPGTYRVKIYGYGSNTGNYRVKASFKSANNNEKSNNNDFVTAMPLQLKQSVTGFLSIDDQVDFFQINVPAKKTIRLIYTSYIRDSYMRIYNKDYIDIDTHEVYYADEENPKIHVYEQELSPGTYYIKIYPYGSNCGRYTLKYEEKIMTKSIKVSGKTQVVAGKSFQLSASVSPSNTTDKTVYWTSGDPYVASVEKETGKVTTYNAGKVRITASAQDGSNVNKVYTVIVLPKKMSISSASNVATKKMAIYFYSQSGVSGYQVQYSTNKNFSGAKTKNISKNRYSVTISKLSKKTYYVRMRGYVKSGSKYYYGGWSSRKTVRIKR